MLPQFSLRTALLFLSAGTAVSIVIAQAARGEMWAVGVAVAAIFSAFALLVHALLYGVARLAGRLQVSSPSSKPAAREIPKAQRNRPEGDA